MDEKYIYPVFAGVVLYSAVRFDVAEMLGLSDWRDEVIAGVGVLGVLVLLETM